MRWVVTLLLLAGCLGSPAMEPPPAQPTQPAPPDPPHAEPPPEVPLLAAFDYHGCAGQVTHVEVSLEAAQAVLPDGHDAWTTGGVRPMAVVEYLWVRCQTFSTAQVTLNQTVYGHVAVRIEARGQAPGEHWYRLRMLTADDVMESVWTAAGYDVYRGDFVEASDPAQTVAVGEYVLQAFAMPQQDTSSRQVTYHTALDDDHLRWHGRIEVEEMTAPGTLQVAADDAFASDVPMPVSARLVSGDFVANELWLVQA